MPHRYMDSQGQEQLIAGQHEIAALLAQGRIRPGTLVFDEESGQWRRAAEVPAILPIS